MESVPLAPSKLGPLTQLQGIDYGMVGGKQQGGEDRTKFDSAIQVTGVDHVHAPVPSLIQIYHRHHVRSKE